MLHPDWANIRRGLIHNEDTGESWQFFMNPEEVSVQIEVNWNKSASLGASSERLSYQNTNNATFDILLRHNRIWLADTKRTPGSSTFDQFVQNQTPASKLSPSDFTDVREEFERRRRFLMSLCYPRGRVNDVIRRSPPQCILVWPGYLAIRVVMRSLQLKDSQFDYQGYPVMFEAQCQFEEYRTYRLTSGDVLRAGFIRQTVGSR